MKLKKYALHWEATIQGTTIVEAFDEEDASEQFDSHITEDMLPDQPINATLEECVLVAPTRKKKAGKELSAKRRQPS